MSASHPGLSALECNVLESCMERIGEQASLFEGEQSGPAGLHYEDDFIAPDEEAALLAAIAGLALREADYRGFTARRRIASYGAGYDFDANVLRPAPPIPVWLHPLRSKVAARADLDPARITHALVTEYRPGTALGWHRDVPDFDVICGVSLGTSCRMRFRRYPPVKGEPVLTLHLAPRSVYVMTDTVRWNWQHSIPPTPALRHSITFRTLTPSARRPNSR